MAGNVWEWTGDPFKIRSLAGRAKRRIAIAARDQEKVLKGGSFLWHHSYCYRYRIAARIPLTLNSAASNIGFRIACDV
jgi:formylglycine-generating enzyme required for sulfatase activity